MNTLNKDNELSKHCQDISATPNINPILASARCEDGEFRLIVIAWVEQVFDKVCANYLFGFVFRFLLNKPLLTILSL